MRNVSGIDPQYTYDANGNVTADSRDNTSLKTVMAYDYRNLLTEIELQKPGTEKEQNDVYHILYNYDEAGNRVRKREFHYIGQESNPAYQGDNNGGTTGDPGAGDNSGNGWEPVIDEYYSRDISGKEIAIYHSNDLFQWNVWGTDNVGKIDAVGEKFFYLKDHLGTVRVVLDETNNIISANDGVYPVML